jgi:hypothetical protein
MFSRLSLFRQIHAPFSESIDARHRQMSSHSVQLTYRDYAALPPTGSVRCCSLPST